MAGKGSKIASKAGKTLSNAKNKKNTLKKAGHELNKHKIESHTGNRMS